MSARYCTIYACDRLRLSEYIVLGGLCERMRTLQRPTSDPCRFNVVAGLDTTGRGAVYTYDAVGSFERVGYAAQGAGQKLIIPLLDDIVGGRNRADVLAPLDAAGAVEIAKEAFVTAGERDMYTGDAVEIFVITAQGIKSERFDLKKD